jgi:hypothetical protein
LRKPKPQLRIAELVGMFWRRRQAMKIIYVFIQFSNMVILAPILRLPLAGGDLQNCEAVKVDLNVACDAGHVH